jgi:hypothetical protein
MDKAPSLPKSFRLNDPIDSIPEGANSVLISCRPVSGGPFSAGSVVDFDLGTRGFLDPTSLAIRYTMTISGPAGNSALSGTPVYTPIQRLQITANGATIDSISQYNQVCHVLTQNLDVAAKYGRQAAYGYTAIAAGTTQNVQNLDGRISAVGVGVNDTYSVSAPLPCILSNCEKMIPLFAVGNIRLTFTLDSLANMFMAAGTWAGLAYIAPTSFSITNFELVYNMMDMGRSVEELVKGMGPRLFLKSHSYNNSATSVAVGATGSNSYVFNQRYSSIRSAFVLPNLTVGNKSYEFCDITSNSGDYQLLCGNAAYPQMPLSTLNNKSGILQETIRAFGNLYDKAGMSIDATEFAICANTGVTVTTTLSPYEPGKFIAGINLERVQSTDHVLLSGISTYNSPISVIVNNTVATSTLCNLNLLLDVDMIVVIDQEAHQVSVRS